MSLFDNVMNVVTLGMYDDLKGELTGANAAREAAQLQDEYNMKYWNMQNEYNHPKAQMQRFAEAGLNPNLIYTQQNTAGDIGAVKVNPRDSLLSTVSKFADVALLTQNLKNMRTQNTLAQAQTSVAQANARRLNYETDWLEDHKTSSFDNSYIRGGKSLLMDFLNLFSGVLPPEKSKNVFLPESEVVRRQKVY